MEGGTGPRARVATADAADADIVIGETGEAGDGGVVGVGGNHTRGGYKAGHTPCHLVVVGTVGVPCDGQLAVGLQNSGIKPYVGNTAGGTNATHIDGKTASDVRSVGAKVNSERTTGGGNRTEC